MAKKSKPKAERSKQGHLEGMEPPSIPKIDKLADAYVEARTERMQLLTEEVKRRDLLEVAMREAGLKVYEYDGKTVELVAEEKVKVRTKKDVDADVDEG